MRAAVFMSNTISSDWSRMFLIFNASMFVMLGVVAVFHALCPRVGQSACGMAAFSLKTLVPVCAIYLSITLAAPLLDPTVALVLDTLAIVVGIFGPAVVNTGITPDLSLISFPHLAERFELITIITFDETIVTMAEVTERFGFGAVSLLTLSSVIALFGCYVVQMHGLLEHHQLRRGLRMIYCHFFIVIAVNLFTVSLNMMVEEMGATLATMPRGRIGGGGPLPYRQGPGHVGGGPPRGHRRSRRFGRQEVYPAAVCWEPHGVARMPPTGPDGNGRRSIAATPPSRRTP